MEIKLLNSTIEGTSANLNEINFGNVKLNSKAVANILIKPEQGEELLSFKGTCGCTSIETSNGVYTVEYKNTNVKKPFSKTMILTYKKDGKEKTQEVKLKGSVNETN